MSWGKVQLGYFARQARRKLRKGCGKLVWTLSFGITQYGAKWDKKNAKNTRSLRHCTDINVYLKKQYSVYITFITEYLLGSKIVVVPEGSLFNMLFCPLLSSNNENLCKKYSLQFTPALHVLNSGLSKPLPKLGPALFVGNPDVGEVKFREQLSAVPDLPSAAMAAEHCSKYFNSMPLLEAKATRKIMYLEKYERSKCHSHRCSWNTLNMPIYSLHQMMEH